MEYNDYHHIHELCDDLHFELKHIHDYSGYIVNGQYCAIKFATMNKISCSSVGCQPERKKTHFNFLPGAFFSYQDLKKFRQEDMVWMTKVPTTPTPSTDKPFPSHTSRSKTRSVFLSQHVDIFDESNCDSTEATLLDQDECDPSPSPTVKSAFNLLGTKRIFTRVHFTFPKDSRKLIIEEQRMSK